MDFPSDEQNNSGAGSQQDEAHKTADAIPGGKAQEAVPASMEGAAQTSDRTDWVPPYGPGWGVVTSEAVQPVGMPIPEGMPLPEGVMNVRAKAHDLAGFEDGTPKSWTAIAEPEPYVCGNIADYSRITHIVAMEHRNVYTENLIFSNGLASIGADAFRDASRLKGILVLPKSCRKVEAGAFVGTKISMVVVPHEMFLGICGEEALPLDALPPTTQILTRVAFRNKYGYVPEWSGVREGFNRTTAKKTMFFPKRRQLGKFWAKEPISELRMSNFRANITPPVAREIEGAIDAALDAQQQVPGTLNGTQQGRTRHYRSASRRTPVGTQLAEAQMKDGPGGVGTNAPIKSQVNDVADQAEKTARNPRTKRGNYQV